MKNPDHRKPISKKSTAKIVAVSAGETAAEREKVTDAIIAEAEDLEAKGAAEGDEVAVQLQRAADRLQAEMLGLNRIIGIYQQKLERYLSKQRRVHGAPPRSPTELRDEDRLLFSRIALEIAGTSQSPWRDMPEVMLASLRAVVAECNRLRNGGNQLTRRKLAAVEIESAVPALAKHMKITKSAVRHKYQQEELPEGMHIEESAADKFARRAVKDAAQSIAKRRRTK